MSVDIAGYFSPVLLMLLVGHGHPACKKWFVGGGGDLTGALRIL